MGEGIAISDTRTPVLLSVGISAYECGKTHSLEPRVRPERPKGMKRIVVAAGLSVFALAAAACSSTGADERERGGSTIVAETEMDEWLAPRPPEEFASGLSIGFIPSGFTFVWNEGHETAVFHVFQTEDGSGQVSIGRQIAPEPYPTPGEQVVRGDRQFTLVEDTREARVLEEIEGDIRLEVVSQTLDSETLLRIAESVVYDPERDN